MYLKNLEATKSHKNNLNTGAEIDVTEKLNGPLFRQRLYSNSYTIIEKIDVLWVFLEPYQRLWKVESIEKKKERKRKRA